MKKISETSAVPCIYYFTRVIPKYIVIKERKPQRRRKRETERERERERFVIPKDIKGKSTKERKKSREWEINVLRIYQRKEGRKEGRKEKEAMKEKRRKMKQKIKQNEQEGRK